MTSLSGEPLASIESKTPRVRRPYQKPAFQFERVFETMALSCSKTGSISLQCRGKSNAS